MDKLGTRVLVAALAVASAVAILAILGLRAWSEQAHEGFRDEVVRVIAQRYHRLAETIPGDPDGIALGGRRRDLGALFARATGMPEPGRTEAIARAFLGDTAIVGRPIVREQPLEDGVPDDTPPAFAAVAPPPKRVKIQRFGPDGSAVR